MAFNRSRFLIPSSLALLFCLTMPAQADTWNEVGDADHLIPQGTEGTGPLTAIMGDHDGWDPVDLYCIQIVDPIAFQATVNCAAINEYDLVLFDENFYGVALTDDCSAGVVLLTGTLVPSAGIYYIGHSSPDSGALSNSGFMWISQIIVQDRAPDGPGAADPLLSWSLGNEAGTPYTINLTGCEFCYEPVPTEQGSWGDLKALFLYQD